MASPPSCFPVDFVPNLHAVDLRPTIAITRAHMKLPELEESVKSGRLVPDGKVCLNAHGELSVTKFAVEPVWYLPGVAERFNIDEGTLRRSLFEHTGGMYPEVILSPLTKFGFREHIETDTAPS